MQHTIILGSLAIALLVVCSCNQPKPQPQGVSKEELAATLDSVKAVAKEEAEAEMETMLDSVKATAKEEAKAEMEEIEQQSSDENYSSTSSYSSESTQGQSVDNSWMDGHWRLRTQYGVSNLYIDTKNKKIKMYTTLYSDGQPNLDYSGTYILYNDASSAYGNAYRGYKALSFGGTVIFADPDVCKLCDGPGEEYFEHVR